MTTVPTGDEVVQSWTSAGGSAASAEPQAAAPRANTEAATAAAAARNRVLIGCSLSGVAGRPYGPGFTRSKQDPSAVLVLDHPADVDPGEQVLVALVDLLEPVPAGDQLVELEVAAAVVPEQPRDVGRRVAVAEQAALDRLLPQRRDLGRELDRAVAEAAAHRGQHDGAGLADGGERAVDH